MEANPLKRVDKVTQSPPLSRKALSPQSFFTFNITPYYAHRSDGLYAIFPPKPQNHTSSLLKMPQNRAGAFYGRESLCMPMTDTTLQTKNAVCAAFHAVNFRIIHWYSLSFRIKPQDVKPEKKHDHHSSLLGRDRIPR